MGAPKPAIGIDCSIQALARDPNSSRAQVPARLRARFVLCISDSHPQAGIGGTAGRRRRSGFDRWGEAIYAALIILRAYRDYDGASG